MTAPLRPYIVSTFEKGGTAMEGSTNKGRNWMIIFWVVVGLLTAFYFISGS